MGSIETGKTEGKTGRMNENGYLQVLWEIFLSCNSDYIDLF